jgi:enoyl-CoA hydratase
MPAARSERSGAVLIITLNRPEVRNAVNQEMADLVGSAMDLLDEDDSLSVGVITGAGSGFCSGMDLRAFARGERGTTPERGFAGMLKRPARKPLIAAIEGFAVAGGLELVLACDLIVAARGAWIGIPETKRSLVASYALMQLPQHFPRAVVAEMALTGEPITTERAAELGLINHLTEVGGALQGALGLAAQVAANAPLALVATKEVLERQRTWDLESFWNEMPAITDAINDSNDAHEGAIAFTEKRAPVWTGT